MDSHILKTEVLKFYFYVAETRLYTLLKVVQFVLNK